MDLQIGEQVRIDVRIYAFASQHEIIRNPKYETMHIEIY